MFQFSLHYFSVFLVSHNLQTEHDFVESAPIAYNTALLFSFPLPSVVAVSG